MYENFFSFDESLFCQLLSRVFKHFFVLMQIADFGVRQLPQCCAITVTFFNKTERMKEVKRKGSAQHQNSDNALSWFEEPERARKWKWDLNSLAAFPEVIGD